MRGKEIDRAELQRVLELAHGLADLAEEGKLRMEHHDGDKTLWSLATEVIVNLDGSNSITVTNRPRQPLDRE